ncbi:MAG TPA: hypothetical protein VM532_01265 [Burkholderiales bacterium]|nr:hypothetical protein [Burkholderiales bacterium]
MRTIKKLVAGLIAAGCAGVLSPIALAQPVEADAQKPAAEISAPTPATENGVTYMSGGIGESEAEFMKRAAKDYDVMLTFATKEQGAYIADVKVDIEDSKGNNVLSTVSEGPIFVADVPPGQYRVTAEAEGKAVTKNIHVSGKQGVKQSLLWSQKDVQTPAPAPSNETTSDQESPSR